MASRPARKPGQPELLEPGLVEVQEEQAGDCRRDHHHPACTSSMVACLPSSFRPMLSERASQLSPRRDPQAIRFVETRRASSACGPFVYGLERKIDMKLRARARSWMNTTRIYPIYFFVKARALQAVRVDPDATSTSSASTRSRPRRPPCSSWAPIRWGAIYFSRDHLWRPTVPVDRLDRPDPDPGLGQRAGRDLGYYGGTIDMLVQRVDRVPGRLPGYPALHGPGGRHPQLLVAHRWCTSC